MIRRRSQRFALAAIIFLAIFGCSLPTGIPPTPTATQALPQASPTALPAASPISTTVAGGNYYGSVLIAGSPEFVEQTHRALALLEAKAPEAYRKIQTYVGIIEQGQHSGMWAWEEPPRYEVGDPTAFYSFT